MYSYTQYTLTSSINCKTWSTSILTLCIQTPVCKRSKQAISKMSPTTYQLTAPGEAEKTGQGIIPHIVWNVNRKNHPSSTDLLKGRILPPLDQVWLPFFFLFLNGNPITLQFIITVYFVFFSLFGLFRCWMIWG